MENVEQPQIFIEEALETSSSDIELERKRDRKIENPLYVADRRYQNPSKIARHRTRDARKYKKGYSKCRPARAWSSLKILVQTPKQPSGYEYACPACTGIGIMNCSQNVHQHLPARHKNGTMPNLEAMIRAACSNPERKSDIDPDNT